MSVTKEFTEYILSLDDITDIIGTNIYSMFIPYGALSDRLPAIVYEQDNNPRVKSHDGNSNLQYPTYTLTCWAATYAVADQLAELLKTELDGYKGTWGDLTIKAVWVENVEDI